MILNPYNFVPLTAHIKLEFNYTYELEHIYSYEVSLMALNNIFTIQDMEMNNKDLSYDIKAKEFEDYWNNECKHHPTNNHCKVYCD